MLLDMQETMRLLPLAVITVVTAAACGGQNPPLSANPDSSAVVSMVAHHDIAQIAGEPRSTVVPPHPEDRRIRRDLNLAIALDSDLKDREISFVVRRGDLNFTGTVRSEVERRKVNDLAMGIDGVKSVANALRVSP